jgi:hypothetical protein
MGEVILIAFKLALLFGFQTITVVSPAMFSSIMSETLTLYVPDFFISNHFENSFTH